ncbi:hypothetical protein [Streptomyces sp. NPDC046385]|uniref:hypothetical protein n=1 Tax=Streptomyces sp. NPDC046385 TaxID=3154918 RepID=UPI003407E896
MKTAKIPKGSRRHRPCPHCGQVKHSTNLPPHKPGGLKRRKAKRSEADIPAAAAVDASPAPLDAVTVIKGIVQGIQEALESASVADTPPTSVLNAAVRKAVLEEFRTRAQFVGRLAEVDALLWSRPEHRGDVVSTAMETHLRELRLLRLTDPEESDRFVVTEGEGELFELLRPGYVDELTGKIILSGQLRRVDRPGHVSKEGQA